MIWFSALVFLCYAPTLFSLAGSGARTRTWGPGFFVPLIAGRIVWRKKDELLALGAYPNWPGLA